MSDAPQFDEAGPDAPPIDELDRIAFDGMVRSAPRFGRFIGTGVAIGALAGLIIGLVLPNSTAIGRGSVALLVASGFAIIGAIVAGALVVTIDGTHEAPASPGFPWEYQPDAEVTSPEATGKSVGPDEAPA